MLETGGMKGRRREMIREELHQELQLAFGPAGIHSEYGMTELLSQVYSLGDGRFHCSAPMRVLLREPSDPFSVTEFRPDGAINVIDLANIDSCAFIETKDLARMHPDGSWHGFGVLPPGDTAQPAGVRLRHRGVFQPPNRTFAIASRRSGCGGKRTYTTRDALRPVCAHRSHLAALTNTPKADVASCHGTWRLRMLGPKRATREEIRER